MFLFSLSKYTTVELLDLTVFLFLVFWGTPKHFPQRLHQFAFPAKVRECSLFSTSSPTPIISSLFEMSHSDLHEMTSYCVCVFNIYLFFRDRDRDTAPAGEWQREGDTESQVGSTSQLSAQSLTRGSISQTARSWPEPKSKSWTLKWLSHPGTS